MSSGSSPVASSSTVRHSSMVRPSTPVPLGVLPPGHFLALPPTFADQSSTTTASHASHLAPNVASLASADFDVDVRTGFLPPTRNVERLPEPWTLWEDALAGASGDGLGRGLKLGGGDREDAWRTAVRDMATLTTDGLASLPLLRRAHLILTFMLHFYVHCGRPDSDATHVPQSISIPLLRVSEMLGLPPVLTYADTVLYNYLPAASGITSMGNMPATTLGTFTHTESEAQFYLISAECEITGAAALRLMRQSLDELFLADAVALRRLSTYLRQLAVVIDRISDTSLKMLTKVDPEEFYHLIRPWFRGGDAAGPDSAGWIFEGTDDDALGAAENRLAPRGDGRKFSGPSAGQSSLIHAIDMFLTVDHAEREDEREAEPPAADDTSGAGIHIKVDSTPVVPRSTSAEKPATSRAAPVEATFLQRMLQYMPLQHRSFLLHLSTHPTPLRPLVVAHRATHPQLAAAYDEALSALKRFRDKHMRIATMFVIQQARRKPSERIRKLLGQMEDDSATEDEGDVAVDGIRGTGGTPLIKFLRRCRDNTTRAMVGQA